MIAYVKRFEKVKFLYRLLNIFKIDKIEDKPIILLPIDDKSCKRKIKKIAEKISKYLYNSNIKSIVLEENLMANEEFKNILYRNNISILDGTRLSKFLVYSVIQKIYHYKKSKIEAGEITILIHENNDIAIENIMSLAKNVKRLNIITNNTKKFKKVVEYLYNELGILIKLSNNMKSNLNSSDIILNIDFPEETLNKLDIPSNAVVVNVPKNVNITSRKFSGINIKDWKIEIPKKYKLQGFDDTIMYEASILKKPTIKVFEQLEDDKVKIKRLIGVNGTINKKEFVWILLNYTWQIVFCRVRLRNYNHILII